MRPLWLLVPTVLLAACLAKSKSVTMPDGRPALRIECNYDFANCVRKAKKECDGDFIPITRGDMSCKDCGTEYNAQGQQKPVQDPTDPSLSGGNNVWKGVYYVRCR